MEPLKVEEILRQKNILCNLSLSILFLFHQNGNRQEWRKIKMLKMYHEFNFANSLCQKMTSQISSVEKLRITLCTLLVKLTTGQKA